MAVIIVWLFNTYCNCLPVTLVVRVVRSALCVCVSVRQLSQEMIFHLDEGESSWSQDEKCCQSATSGEGFSGFKDARNREIKY